MASERYHPQKPISNCALVDPSTRQFKQLEFGLPLEMIYGPHSLNSFIQEIIRRISIEASKCSLWSLGYCWTQKHAGVLKLRLNSGIKTRDNAEHILKLHRIGVLIVLIKKFLKLLPVPLMLQVRTMESRKDEVLEFWESVSTEISDGEVSDVFKQLMLSGIVELIPQARLLLLSILSAIRISETGSNTSAVSAKSKRRIKQFAKYLAPCMLGVVRLESMIHHTELIAFLIDKIPEFLEEVARHEPEVITLAGSVLISGSSVPGPESSTDSNRTGDETASQLNRHECFKPLPKTLLTGEDLQTLRRNCRKVPGNLYSVTKRRPSNKRVAQLIRDINAIIEVVGLNKKYAAPEQEISKKQMINTYKNLANIFDDVVSNCEKKIVQKLV